MEYVILFAIGLILYQKRSAMHKIKTITGLRLPFLK